MGAGRIPPPMGEINRLISYARGTAPATRDYDFKSPPQNLKQLKAVVMERQVVYHIIEKHRNYCPSVPEDELDIIEKPHRMRTAAAADCRTLLVDARAQLKRDKQNNDARALSCSSIVIHSAYRTIAEDTASWHSTFNEYYTAHLKAKPKLAADAYGPAVQNAMLKMMREGKAVPGFSNHSQGLAVDFGLTLDGTYLKPKRILAKTWRATWLHRWLVQNAGKYKFRPLATEEWHWDHDP